MRKILGIVLVIAILLVLSIAGMATENISNNDIVRLSIKSKSLGSDKNWNTDQVHINITINKLGHLVYIENYYTEGSEVLKLYSSGRYYDTNITNNSLSFDISRPKSKSGKTYSYMKSIILLDNKIVFEQLLNASNRFKLDYSNIQYIKVIKNDTKSGSKNETLSGTQSRSLVKSSINSSNNTGETNKINNEKENKGIPLGLGIVTIVMVSAFYAFRRKK